MSVARRRGCRRLEFPHSEDFVPPRTAVASISTSWPLYRASRPRAASTRPGRRARPGRRPTPRRGPSARTRRRTRSSAPRPPASRRPPPARPRGWRAPARPGRHVARADERAVAVERTPPAVQTVVALARRPRGRSRAAEEGRLAWRSMAFGIARGCQVALEQLREPLDVVGPERRRRDEVAYDPRGRLAPQAPKLALLLAHDAAAARTASRAPDGTRSPAPSMRATSAPENRRGRTALSTTASRSRPSIVATRSSRSSASDTAFLRLATVTIAARAGSSSSSATRRACVAIGRHGDVGERAGRPQQADPVARRRAVDDDEVVAPRGARPPLGAPELPRLRDRDELARARRGREERAERARRGQRVGDAARADDRGRPLLERGGRIDGSSPTARRAARPRRPASRRAVQQPGRPRLAEISKGSSAARRAPRTWRGRSRRSSARCRPCRSRYELAVQRVDRPGTPRPSVPSSTPCASPPTIDGGSYRTCRRLQRRHDPRSARDRAPARDVRPAVHALDGFVAARMRSSTAPAVAVGAPRRAALYAWHDALRRAVVDGRRTIP